MQGRQEAGRSEGHGRHLWNWTDRVTQQLLVAGKQIAHMDHFKGDRFSSRLTVTDGSGQRTIQHWRGGGRGSILWPQAPCVWPEQGPEGLWAASSLSPTPETEKPKPVRMGHTPFDATFSASFKRPSPPKDEAG